MNRAPVFDIDPRGFWLDPYPALKQMRQTAPLVYVPQLDAFLMTRRNDVFVNEKRTEIFSSDQPDGLMTKLMGQNMMRKDGEAHLAERKAIFPTVSPKTVKNIWKEMFQESVSETLDDLSGQTCADMIHEIAMRISGEALKAMSGLTQISWREMDRISQGMIDGCANYAGDADIAQRCDDATQAIDRYIDERTNFVKQKPDHSLLSVQLEAGLRDEQIRANIKLAISGGQNEPRDAIAGLAWALITHPEQLAKVLSGEVSWLNAFEEYVRWISPIGMSPRRIVQHHEVLGVALEPEDRVFLMFGSANRDETVFENADAFDVSRDTSQSIAFGAGPHFCAGAWASRCLIAEVAMPMIFDRLPRLRIEGAVEFGGWAFRGPTKLQVAWQ